MEAEGEGWGAGRSPPQPRPPSLHRHGDACFRPSSPRQTEPQQTPPGFLIPLCSRPDSPRGPPRRDSPVGSPSRSARGHATLMRDGGQERGDTGSTRSAQGHGGQSGTWSPRGPLGTPQHPSGHGQRGRCPPGWHTQGTGTHRAHSAPSLTLSRNAMLSHSLIPPPAINSLH